MPRLVFAQHRGGRIVHVAEVPSGLACNCTCLDCGEPLVARKGEIREHHFGHTSGKEHDWAWETHLHAYAKQLIAQEGGLQVPVHEGVIEYLGLDARGATALLRAGAAPIQTEVRVGAVRPDLLVHLQGRDVPIALEVYVTHACDRAKVAEYRRLQLAVLEIDLSRFPKYRFEADRLKEAVLRSTANKAWLWPLPPTPAPKPTWLAAGTPIPRAPGASPDREGPSPPLPGPASLRFAVPAWNSVIAVGIQPVVDGIQVIVGDMPMGLANSPAQHAAPRIAQLVSTIIERWSPEAQHQRSGKWFVPAWSAAAVAKELQQAAAGYEVAERESCAGQVASLASDTRYGPRARPLQSRTTDSDPKDSPYARRRG